MSTKLVEGIESKLREYVTPERYEHTLNVRNTALRLGEKYGGGLNKIEIASLLHDVARDLSLERMQRLVKEEQLDPGEAAFIYNSPLLLHSYAGKEIARRDFMIRDPDILEAVRVHTAGARSMGIIARIVFVADYIEPGRTFRGIKRARELAGYSLERVMLYIYKTVMKRLLQNNRFLCQDTLFGYNELVLKKTGSGWTFRIKVD
ncbi:MAG: bis(5'-nucleosyl)-tetraphosphatase (symmetrical) YqeK [Spirochaetota bacterium]